MAKQVEINGEKYIKVTDLDGIYLGGISEMHQFCECAGWGCVF